MLSIAAAEREEEWDLRLPVVMMAYRSSMQEITGATSFSLMFGREVRLPIDLVFDTPPGYPSPSLTNRYATLRKYLQEAYHFFREHTKSRQLRQKGLCDRRIGGKPYQVHDRVWLHCPAVPKGRAHRFHRQWQGPFRVVTVLSDAVYRIEREGSRQRKVVHFDRLKPYHGPQMEEGEEATQADRETQSSSILTTNGARE